MAELFPITDTEMEAIRSVERWIGNEMQKDFNAPSLPIQDDVAILSRLLYRLAPAPPVEEVASRPGDWAKDLAAPDNGTGDPRAGSPIGIVRDHPSKSPEDSQGPSVVDRGSREIGLRWAKETIGLVAVELNEAYAKFDTTRDNGSIPSGTLCQASRRLEEAMKLLGLTDEIPF